MLSNKGKHMPQVVCPYDPSHVLLEHRVQTHLVKCRRNHPTSKKATCYFNSTHIVPEVELKFHMERCPERLGLDKFVYLPEDVDTDKFPVKDLGVRATECWDDENCPTYDPQQYCVENVIVRNAVINTESAAKRKTFRMKDRRRIHDLVDTRPVSRPEPTEQQVRSPNKNVAKDTADLSQDDPFNYDEIMKQVKLGSILTTPKVVVDDKDVVIQYNAENQNDTANVAMYNNEFPPLHGGRGSARRYEANMSAGKYAN